MKLNRKWLMVIALVLSLTMATAGTLAYLTDSDKDVNTMTLGRVEIVQNEQERTEDGELDEFTQDKPLLPAYFEGNSIPWADEDEWPVPGDQAWKVVEDNEGVIDKFVTVTNTGKTDAYVRTIIAYEGDETYGPEGAYIHVVHNATNVDPDIKVECMGTYTIDGVKYTVYVYTYPEVLAADETTIPSLKQVYMNKSATNEVVEQYGATYDILVLSQAMQAQGFNDAKTALNEGFGEVTQANLIAWWDETGIGSPGEKNDTNNPPEIKLPNGDDDSVTYDIPANATRVTNSAELVSAIENGETDIVLEAGEYNWGGTAKQGSNPLYKLNLYGESKGAILYMTKEGGEGADYDFDGYDVTFTGLTISNNKYTSTGNYYPGWARMEATYNDCVINGMYVLYGESEFNYCTLNVTGDTYNIWTWGAGKAAFDHCTFNSDGKSILVYASSCDLTISNCKFNDSDALAPVKAAIETGSDNLTAIYHNINVSNTTVNGFAVNTTNCDKVTTTLWANKNGMDQDHLNVIVDGVDVY